MSEALNERPLTDRIREECEIGMTNEEREMIDDRICEIMIEHGPDRHIDGHELLTDYAVELITAERERCLGIVADELARWKASGGRAGLVASETCEGIADRIASGKPV